MGTDHSLDHFYAEIGMSPLHPEVVLDQFFGSSAECACAAEKTKARYPTMTFRLWQRNSFGQWISLNSWII